MKHIVHGKTSVIEKMTHETDTLFQNEYRGYQPSLLYAQIFIDIKYIHVYSNIT